MRLPIECWLESQNFNESIKELFREAIICYKASAYRASLLFSYLGFQSVIKDRVLNAEKPGNIHEIAWETIKKNLRKEDTWDAEVNECIKKSDENKRIFIITEDLRQQAIYWKYRRNDCAHSKPNMIEASHVETFWSFLYSNLPKFVVNGSKESLLQRIERHFDQNYTKYDEDFTYLIQEVQSAVYEEELEDFINKIDKIFNSFEIWYPVIAERAMSFWNGLIKMGAPITNKVIEHIKSNIELEEVFFDLYPEQVLTFYGSDSSEVRSLWRVKIHNWGNVKFKVVSSLLRNGLVVEDKNEMFNHLILQIGLASPNEKDIPCLLEHGYFSKYKAKVFTDHYPLIKQFDWGNKSQNSIGRHIDIMGLDNDIVITLNNTFSAEPYPFKLRDSLKKYFIESPDKKEEYVSICRSLGIEPVSNLGF